MNTLKESSSDPLYSPDSSSCSSSSCDDSNSSTYSSSTTPTPVMNINIINNNNNSNNIDPYSDVRTQLEKLCHDDRAHQNIHRAPQSRSPEIPFFAACTTYWGYIVLIVLGHIRDLCASLFRSGRYLEVTSQYPSDNRLKYAALLKSWENFYTRRLYHRIQDCFNRPITGIPGCQLVVLERVSENGNKTLRLAGSSEMEEYIHGEHFLELDKQRLGRSCINLGSYNYLGFADDWKETCEEKVLGCLKNMPISCGSCGVEGGRTVLHEELELIVARFLNKESAMVLNMGYGTNSTTIPALVTQGDLLISDELNHTSIVNGARRSGAAIRTFRHNDANHLETILREAIVLGRPRTRRPFKKILVILEGVYSMEGEYCNLKAISSTCQKYGAYLYLDEAHSIGAMGPTGRGCAEYCNVPTDHIDIYMGTFSKSFAGMGGYIASSKEVIDSLRNKCAGSSCHVSMSPIICQQVITAFKVITGEDGTTIGKNKLRSLKDNSNYFRMRLTQMGLHVLGNYDSPVIPVMLYNPTKIAAFSRECYKRGLAVVVVGFPAVPILMSRARFCISAGHNREELDLALKEIDEIADILKLRYARSTFG